MLGRLKTFQWLFIGTVIVPTLLAIIYLGLLANDVYISESRFVVRSPTKTSINPLSSMLSGVGIGGGSEELDAVTEYVESRDALRMADADGLVVGAYTRADIFFLDRFGALFGDSREELYEYYLGKVEIAEGTTTQVTTLTVRAFDPDDAQKINERLLEKSEELVNSLSDRARKDSVELAQTQVDEAGREARDAAIALAQYRDRQKIVDPQEQSEVGLQMIAKLQDELIAARTQLRQMQTYTPQASQIPFLRTQIAALEAEIAETKGDLAGSRGSLSSAMVRYQELSLNSKLAEQQLAIMLAALKEAEAESRRKRAYVERISDPSLPDHAVEPRRIRGIVATFILGLLAWGVLSMLLIGVREHHD